MKVRRAVVRQCPERKSNGLDFRNPSKILTCNVTQWQVADQYFSGFTHLNKVRGHQSCPVNVIMGQHYSFGVTSSSRCVHQGRALVDGDIF